MTTQSPINQDLTSHFFEIISYGHKIFLILYKLTHIELLK